MDTEATVTWVSSSWVFVSFIPGRGRELLRFWGQQVEAQLLLGIVVRLVQTRRKTMRQQNSVMRG
jgi:hypothetical protein